MADTSVVWLEYLVVTETFDRSCSGYWHTRTPDVWIVATENFRAACDHARLHHARAVACVKHVTGKDRIDVLAESEVVQGLLELTHERRVELLDGRSPATELFGP